MLIHDVRNPLATAHAYVQVLRRRAASARLHPIDLDQGLQHIDDAVARIERLLDLLSDMPEDFGPDGTDLIELAREMARPVQRITVLPEVEPIVGNWDRVDIERVLSNLLENALNYSPSDQPVLLTVRSEGDVAILSVADRGFGIPGKDLPHVFDPGFRTANAAALASGSGLGLATVRNIVRHYGGEITIDSQPGVGTTVTVHLPLEQERQSES